VKTLLICRRNLVEAFFGWSARLCAFRANSVFSIASDFGIGAALVVSAVEV
jgi:hypothetical protein